MVDDGFELAARYCTGSGVLEVAKSGRERSNLVLQDLDSVVNERRAIGASELIYVSQSGRFDVQMLRSQRSKHDIHPT